jgi:two-component system, OmpR family, phosphate regulon response regulator PhoB
MSKILMIDDDEEYGAVTAAHFKAQGYDFTLVDGGKAGLAKAAALKPDIIFLDITMPDMNGMEVLRELQAGDETGEIPVLLVSGKYLDQGMFDIFAQERNFKGFVSKPVVLSDLQKRVEALLGK